MKPQSRMTNRVVIVLTLFLLSGTAANAAPDGWHAVQPGFSAQVLLGRGNVMWAAGSEESIAESTDGGEHWSLKHHDPKGALLMVLQFVGDKFGYAAGTGGKVLFTEDGGETWTGQKMGTESILQAAFGDEQHGVVRTESALRCTTDGGKTWKPITPANDPAWDKKFRFTVDLAALDKDRMAVRVSEGEFGDGEYLSTGDGGATWNATYIPSSGIHDLIVVDGEYWSIGHEVLGKDKPGGGYGVATFFRSRNGTTWEHVALTNSVCKSETCGGCTAQGCLASKSSFVQMKDGKDWLAKFPPHDGLSSQWARSGNKLCLLSQSSIECTNLEPVAKIDTKGGGATWESESIPPLGMPTKSGAGPNCIRCQLPPMFITKSGESGVANIEMSFTLEPSGHVDNVAIVGKIPEDVKTQLRAAIAGWLFEPYVQDGVPTKRDIGIHGRIMILNPEKTPAAPARQVHPN